MANDTQRYSDLPVANVLGAADSVLGMVGGALSRITGAVFQALISQTIANDNQVNAITSSGGVLNIDLSLPGKYITVALRENITSITFSNLPGNGFGGTRMIRFTQDTTARTVAWPASFRWGSSGAGMISTAPGAVDLLAITTFDNGTKWDATLSTGRT